MRTRERLSLAGTPPSVRENGSAEQQESTGNWDGNAMGLNISLESYRKPARLRRETGG